MIVAMSCPKCHSSMEGEHRGIIANFIALKRTNTVRCTSCFHEIDMEEYKNNLLPKGVDIPQ